MELFKAHAITTPECFVANTAEEAEHIAICALNRRTCCSAVAVFFPCGLPSLGGASTGLLIAVQL
jgi:hypothetical protein